MNPASFFVQKGNLLNKSARQICRAVAQLVE
jgi:hypothetical protein